MSNILALIIELFRQYNIIGLATIVIIQGIGIPTGAGILVVAMGAFAFAGEFNFFLLFCEVWFFASIGDCLGYWTWRLFGRYILNSFPKMNRYLEPKLKKTGVFFKKHGHVAIFLTRFPLSAMGALVNVTAGITKYKFQHFILTAIIGELMWVTAYLGLGYWFGDAWETISDLITQFGLLFTLLILLTIVIYSSYKLLFKGKVDTFRKVKDYDSVN